MNLQTFISFL